MMVYFVCEFDNINCCGIMQIMKIINDLPQSILINKNDGSTLGVNGVLSVEYLPYETGEIVAYSQRDDRWKNDFMVSPDRIGGWGCAMVCAAMLSSQFDQTVTPKTLNQYLLENNGYTNDNRLIWQKVCGLTPQLSFVQYYLWRDVKANIPLFLEEVNKRPVIIQVDFTPGGSLNTHFVLALSSDGVDVDIIDPWDGARTKLLQRYALKDWDLARAIYAMAVYEY